MFSADIAALIKHFSLKTVMFVAWSYGGRVVNDYLVRYGETKVRGINFIAAGTLATEAVKGPGYKVLANLFSEDTTLRQQAERQFVDDLCAKLDDPGLLAQMRLDLFNTPLYVRLNMRNRQMDYEATLAALSKPVLLTHGQDDHYSLPLLAELLQQHLQRAQTSWYTEAGHIPFVSDYPRFNQELAVFAERLLS
jgi:non-heme chloroperoxidase